LAGIGGPLLVYPRPSSAGMAAGLEEQV